MNSFNFKEDNMVEIGGMLVSSIEFPGKISLVIFTAGCILKCPYCHNAGIIEGGNPRDIREIFQEINESLDFIDSVVITGGEPLIQKRAVIDIIKYCKNLKLDVKLDTSGCYPERLEELIELVDYVALDVKVPFNKYKKVIGEDIGEKVRRSMEICLLSNTYLECRTTYVPTLIDPEDMVEIVKEIDCDIYTIQQFKNTSVLDETLLEVPSPSRTELLKIVKLIKPFIKRIKIKTSEFGDEIIE